LGKQIDFVAAVSECKSGIEANYFRCTRTQCTFDALSKLAG